MFEELPLFLRSEFVVERNQRASRVKNGVRGNQPLRLIRHDDAGSPAACEPGVLQSPRQRMRPRSKFAIRHTLLLTLAIRFDQAHFIRKLIQRILKRLADGLIFGKVQHYRRD
jgi:hypothetical protein